VGQQDGLCYYAMQFIRGQGLDEVFRELQHLRTGSVPGVAREGTAPGEPLARSLWTGAFKPAASADSTADLSGGADFQSARAGSTDWKSVLPKTAAAALPDRSE